MIFVHKTILTKYEVLTRIQLRYLLVQTLRFTLKIGSDIMQRSLGMNTFSLIFMKSCLGSENFPEISGIHPTLRSCISELTEYFLMGLVPLQRSMSKL